MTRPSSRLLAVIAVVGVAIAASLIGGAGPGLAATNFQGTLTPLIGTTGQNIVGQVSYGDKIGYELTVTNNDTNNTTHVRVVVDLTNPDGTPSTAQFYDATDPSCAAAKGNPSEMVCVPNGGTLNAQQSYTVDFRFLAPTSGSSVIATPSITIAAKTQSTGGSNGTTAWTGAYVTTNLVQGGSITDTFLRGNEKAFASGPQYFETDLPPTLLFSPFGLELGINNQGGKICDSCLGVFTELTIPLANHYYNPLNPFYDGTTFNPYGWKMSATAPTSFKLNGVFHLPDGTTTPVQIPACAGGVPTVSSPVCYDTLTSKNKGGVQYLNATGQGLENGRVGFG